MGPISSLDDDTCVSQEYVRGPYLSGPNPHRVYLGSVTIQYNHNLMTKFYAKYKIRCSSDLMLTNVNNNVLGPVCLSGCRERIALGSSCE